MRKIIFKLLFSSVVAFMPTLCTCAGVSESVTNAFISRGVKADEVAIWASRVDGSAEIIEHNAMRLMQPASVIKVVTTLCALDILSPKYTWKTGFYASSFPDKSGTVKNFAILGGGDPHLVVENLWVAIARLKSLGLKKINGNILADRGLFQVQKESSSAFDGKSIRSYNVQPSATLVNFQSLSLEIIPDLANNVARIVAVPDLAGVHVTRTLPLKKGACGAWQDAMQAKITPKEIRFLGSYPASCGKKAWHMALWDENTYLTAILKTLFESNGIVWNGQVVSGQVGSSSVLLLNHESEPLREIIAYINKFSNNPMARQLFLTLATGNGTTGNLEQSRININDWLSLHQIPHKGTFIANGSGLSRQTQISAKTLGMILNYGANSPYGAEFIASLPVAGIDGTMKRRSLKSLSAHIKTGRIDHVRSVAGYVRDKEGKDWAVAIIVNSKKADLAVPAIDYALNWIATRD